MSGLSVTQAYLFGALINADEVGIPKATESGLLQNILNPVYFWAGAIAVIVIIIGGFMYVTSSGDASRVTRAKNAIIAACLGLIIILTAFVITNFVIGRF